MQQDSDNVSNERRGRVKARVCAATSAAASVVLVGVAGHASADALGDLAEHRARWLEQDRGSYVYAYQKYCECNRDEPPETVVTVEDGAIVRVYHVHEGSSREVPARDGSLDLYWTIDGLFDLIDSALARDAAVRVRYDETLGHPQTLFIDYDEAFVGDELDLRLTRVDTAEAR
jgi:hypothetical protein